MPLSLGSDIGGTFTDFALVDTETGDIRIHKRLTTPRRRQSFMNPDIASLRIDKCEIRKSAANIAT